MTNREEVTQEEPPLLRNLFSLVNTIWYYLLAGYTLVKINTAACVCTLSLILRVIEGETGYP